MPHKRRKIRKKRGSRTVGYGRIGQHRGGGQRGGHGKAGRRKHLWSYVLRYDPDYFEKKGFYSPRAKTANVVNVGELEELAVKLAAEQRLPEKDGKPLLDLSELGYDKLLGMGTITQPFAVKIESWSKSAAEKVENAEGTLVSEMK